MAVPTADIFAGSLFLADLKPSGPQLTTFAGQGAYTGLSASITPLGTAPVPEPAFFQMGTLLGIGAIGWVMKRRRNVTWDEETPLP